MIRLLRLQLCLIVLLGLGFRSSAQIVYNFTTAGATGKSGPTQAQINTAYSGSNLSTKVTSSNGIQLWTVPFTGPYRIVVAGAQGGNGAGKNGGLGASLTGEVMLNAGTVLKILVGQRGGSRAGSFANDAGAGGGGSFVTLNDNTPVIIAGAGGGSGYGENGLPGNISLNGGSSGANSGLGGLNGGGGGAALSGSAGNNTTPGGNGGSCSYGSGGGGFYTRGGYNCSGTTMISGNSFVSGGEGGIADVNTSGVQGGFGGGAGVGHRSGGGGGWSGGGGAADNFGGGGGGSFNSGTNQVNSAGINAGDGSVSITLLYFTSISETAFVSCNGAADATISANVNGGVTPYSYAWNTGATSATLTNVPAGVYSVTVTDANSLTTSATYTVLNPVTITAQPSAATVSAGVTATFAAAATGTNLTYNWQADAGSGFQNLSNGGIYGGATTPTLTVNATYAQHNLRYRLMVYHNSCAGVPTGAATLTVNRLANSIGSLALTDTKTYGDASYSLNATSTNNAAPLVYSVASGDAVTVSASGTIQVVKAGTAVVNVTQAADDTYQAASASQTITVGAKSITVTANAQSKTYGAADPSLTYTFTPTLVGADTFTGNLTRTAGENIGSYAITNGTLSLGSNYSMTVVPATLTINSKAITVTADAKSKTYGAGDPALTYTFTPALAFADTFTGNLTRTAGENVGNYAINQGSLALSSNYALTVVPSTLTINSKAIIVTADAKSKIYGAGDPALTYTFTPALVNTDTFTGNLIRTAGENVGSYAISQGSLALNGNYALTVVPATLTINSKAITVTADAKSKIYGAGDPALTYTFTPALVNTDTFTGNLTRMAGENVGSYAISQGSLALSGNYALTVVPSTLTINSKAITVTADAKSKIYGAGDPALTYTFTPALVNTDSFTGNLNRTAGENVGSYTISQGSLALSSNYALTVVPSTLTINTKAITVTADAKSKTYGNADPVLTYTFSPALAFADTFTGSLTRAAGNNIGSYAITSGTLALNANYVLSVVPSTLTINSRAITVNATAVSKTYGSGDPALTYTFTPALAFSDTFTGNLTRTAGENVGSYTINQGSLSLNANYTVSYNGAALSIVPKALTITAENKTRLQGVANPTLTANYSGFINGENNTNALSVQPTLSTTATSASPQGNYAITVSGAVATNGNYSISYVAGTLTVTPGVPTALALAAATVYENRPAGTFAGTLSSVSPDPNAIFSYSLVAGAGSTDNAKFNIAGNQLLTATVLDYETQSSFNIRVRTTNQYGLSLEQAFVVNIADVNEAPTMDAVANQTICYTTAAQNINLTGITAGPELGQTVSITVTNNNPGLFRNLSVNQTTGILTYSISNGWQGTASLSVIVKDNGGTANSGADTYTRTFNITVNPLPVVTIWSSSGSNSVSKGETISLKADAPGALSYSWANANGVISGQNTATLRIRPTQTTTYTVTAFNATGCSEIKQITIEVRSDFNAVKANNILTPNGDGSNDTWVITNIDQYPNAEVKVFDRSGRIVYARKGYDNSWNGTFNGTPLNEGAYLYVIDFGNGLYKAKGTLTILNNR